MVGIDDGDDKMIRDGKAIRDGFVGGLDKLPFALTVGCCCYLP